MSRKTPSYIATLSLASVLAWATPAYAVEVSADAINSNAAQQIVAEGNVELVNAGRVIRADRIVYDLRADAAFAYGNISYLDENGRVHFSERMQLPNDFRQGLLQGIQTNLRDDVKKDLGAPVDMAAESLTHNNNTQQVFAEGNVELINEDGRVLKADQIVYDLQEETAFAYGNVSYLDSNGDVHFAEEMELSGDFRDGFVQGLRSQLSDGSRFTAETAVREAGRKTTMSKATYTPCKICKDGKKKKPLWQIRADKVVYDEEDRDVGYKNARLEILGVPIAYTPIFSHPDPKRGQKSGFLRPKGGWTSDLGGFVKGSYYWGISPDKDATLSIQPTTKNGVLSELEYRQRFQNGKVNFNASLAVDSDRTEENGVVEQGKQRAHIATSGVFDLTDRWRAGFNLERTTDKEYMRLYDINNANILTSRLYAERFSNRNYSKIEGLSFQDLRINNSVDQPEILPWFEHTMYGQPGRLLGGRWMFGLSGVGLHRSNAEQDMYRGSLEAGWERQFLTQSGLKTVLEANLRGDVYEVRDSVVVGVDDGTETRFMPYLHAKMSYPFVRPMRRGNWIVEPIMSATIAGRADDDDEIIPNEDSVDVQLDVSNLFDPNRFPGLDRVEDGGHGAYGLKTGFVSHNNWATEIFLGQSIRFEEDSNLFPTGSGLEEQSSDIVGAVSFDFGKALDLDYKMQLDHDSFRSRRHELQASGKMGDWDYNTRYVFADAVAGTGFTESREQIQLGGGYQINDFWKTNMSTLTDLGEQPGLRRASMGLHYQDECLSFSLIGLRNLTNRTSGENETSVLVRLGLKHLGEFSTPEILLNTTTNN